MDMEEITLRIDRDVQEWLDRMVDQYGYNPAYWLMEAARVARFDLEDSQAANRAMLEMKIQGREPVSSEELKRK